MAKVLARRSITRYRNRASVIVGMTKTKYLYALLALSLTLALWTGVRRLFLATFGTTASTASTGSIGTELSQAALSSSQATTATATISGTTGQLAGDGLDVPPSTVITNTAFVQIVVQDADTLNPLLTTNATSRAVFQKIYPVLVDQDPASGLPTVGRGLATQWQFAADNRTITFTLRSDIRWSDGVPVTAQDVKFTYDAIRNPAIETVYRENFANVTDVTLVADQAQTLVLHLANADCAILQVLNQPILPSHLYNGWSAAQLTGRELRPLVSAGPFQLADWQPGRQLTLVRNESYWEGAPRLARWEFHVIPDPVAQLQALLTGAADWLEVTPAQLAQVKARPDLHIYEALADSLTFVALNLANSQNPQAGRNPAGTPLPQEPHPILADQRMRLALAKSIDYTALLQSVAGDNNLRLGSYLLPTIPWAYASELAPVDYDRARAQQLLDELGWRDSDGDGVRDRSGVPLSLSLLTNSDSEQRVALAQLLAEQWKQVGINIRFEQLPFDAVADRLLGQQYDMVLIGWDNLGPEPANSDFWHSRYDAPGSGANFVSYQNAQVDTWLDAARTAPACDPAVRGKLYDEVQRQIYADLPYIFLTGQVKRWAYPTAWHEINPAPWRFDYNARLWWKP